MLYMYADGFLLSYSYFLLFFFILSLSLTQASTVLDTLW